MCCINKVKYVLFLFINNNILFDNKIFCEETANIANNIIQKNKRSGSDFTSLVTNGGYIDKTKMIKYIFDERFIVITTPKYFGKTTNMQTIKKFIEFESDESISIRNSDNYKFFRKNKLKIMKYKKLVDKHFGRYFVIYMNFKKVTGKNYDEILNKFQSLVYGLYNEHTHLWNGTKIEIYDEYNIKNDSNKGDSSFLLEKSLNEFFFLLQLVKKYSKNRKIYLLINGYDESLIKSNLYQLEYRDIKYVYKFYLRFFTKLLKYYKKFVGHTLVIGTSYFMINEFCRRNNITIYRFLDDHKFSKFFGIYGNEIFKNRILKNSNFMYFYRTIDGTKLYDYTPIMKSVTEKIYNLYEFDFVKIFDDNLFRYRFDKLIKNDSVLIPKSNLIAYSEIWEMKYIIEHPVAGREQVIDFDMPFQYLLDLGFFTYDKKSKYVNKNENIKSYYIKLINDETKLYFENNLNKYYESIGIDVGYLNKCSRYFNKLTDVKLLKENLKRFKYSLEDLLKKSTKSKNYSYFNNETLHDLLTSVVAKSEFKFLHDYQMKNVNKFELMVYRKKLGLIIEFKDEFNFYNVFSIENLMNRHKYFYIYSQFQILFRKKIKDMIFIGLNYDSKYLICNYCYNVNNNSIAYLN